MISDRPEAVSTAAAFLPRQGGDDDNHHSADEDDSGLRSSLKKENFSLQGDGSDNDIKKPYTNPTAGACSTAKEGVKVVLANGVGEGYHDSSVVQGIAVSSAVSSDEKGSTDEACHISETEGPRDRTTGRSEQQRGVEEPIAAAEAVVDVKSSKLRKESLDGGEMFSNSPKEAIMATTLSMSTLSNEDNSAVGVPHHHQEERGLFSTPSKQPKDQQNTIATATTTSAATKSSSSPFSSEPDYDASVADGIRRGSGGIQRQRPPPSHVIVRVVKGEIRRVLAVMRTQDRRSPSTTLGAPSNHHHRFGGGGGGNSNNNDNGTAISRHPVAMQLQHLHTILTERESMMLAGVVDPGTTSEGEKSGGGHYRGDNGGNKLQNDYRQPTGANDQSYYLHLDPTVYLEPFCAAVQDREINASITGSALDALHKFLLYGFLDCDGGRCSGGVHCDAEEMIDPSLLVKKGMVMIANALLQCTFEESSSFPSLATTSSTSLAASMLLDVASVHSTSRQQARRPTTSSNNSGGNNNNGNSNSGGKGGPPSLRAAFAAAQASAGSTMMGSSQRSIMSAATAPTVTNTASSSSGGNLGGFSTPTASSSSRIPSRTSSSSSNSNGGANHNDDERVVLKLLELVNLVVRCSLRYTTSSSSAGLPPSPELFIPSDIVIGLLDTCLHVSHKAFRASSLLKAAASSALSQVVLQVFHAAAECQPSTTDNEEDGDEDDDHHDQVASNDDSSGQLETDGVVADAANSLLTVRRAIWMKLVDMLNPTSPTNAGTAASSTTMMVGSIGIGGRGGSSNSIAIEHDRNQRIATTSTSLSLVNMALETIAANARCDFGYTHHPVDDLSHTEIILLQGDLCKHVLQWTTTHNILLLQSTLRVIYNLFQTMRDHLKVPFEVFLTSVHFRILLSGTATDEEREVALESLLEFCQEPTTLQDLYLNYDCDIACTNLYERVVAALAQVATPEGCWTMMMNHMGDGGGGASSGTGGSDDDDASSLFMADSVGNVNPLKDAGPNSGGSAGTAIDGGTLNGQSSTTTSGARSGMQGIIPLATGASVGVNSTPLSHLNRLALQGILSILDSIDKRCQIHMKTDQSGSWSANESGVDEHDGFGEELGCNDRHGRSVVSDRELHERRQRKRSLVRVARAFNQDEDWKSVAFEENLIEDASSPKGAAGVLYTAPGLNKEKLGKYLSKGPEKDFPFEAAIRNHFVSMFDFKEMSFSHALRKFLSKFRLPGEAQCIDRLMEAFSSQLFKQLGAKTFFKNSDAIYVLAFSTIMLNTDLHNPMIKHDQRMTMKQFIRNNRGINGGEDLPEEFVSELYEQIKAEQIQVRRELGDFVKKHENEDFLTAWEGMLAKRGEVATPFFTSAGVGHPMTSGSRIHDREMFLVLARPALQALAGVFVRTGDDVLVFRSLQGLKQLVGVAAYFEVDAIINDVLMVLLVHGRDYVMSCITIDIEGGVSFSRNTASDNADDDDDDDDDDHSAFDSDENPIPHGLLCSGTSDGEVDITGSASHRGLLALDSGFVLVRQYATRANAGTWTAFIECLCCLRDAQALPAGLANLDDFADSSGKVLPLSSFAKSSQRRLEDHFRALADRDKEKGWFRSFFRKPEGKPSEHDDDDVNSSPLRLESSLYTKTLLSMVEEADVEHVIQMGSTELPAAEQAIRTLLDALDGYPYKEDPVQEQHAIFSLELAARALLSNRDRATELFSMFLTKFERILDFVTEKSVPAPFVIERIVVTILRSCIHLYEIPELRPHLRASLHLIMLTLPRSYLRKLANRVACGLAIILRASFHYFETPNEWTFMGDTLDLMANYNSSRVFVFDGIASTVEYALPNGELLGDDSDRDRDEGPRPTLSMEASTALSRILIRFVLGFYQNDLLLQVPAMLCLEKVYRHRVDLLLQEKASKGGDEGPTIDPLSAVPDKEAWQNVAVAVYSVCRSQDPESSRQGLECYQRVILQTATDQVAEEKWVSILYLMVNKQPPVSAGASRGNTFSALGHLMSRVLPALSYKSDLREDLVDLISQTAALAQENLRQGRKGSVSPLFETTLQTMTYLSNHMMTEEWKGEPEFSAWASEELLSELEKVGAAGASLKNQAAVQPTQEAPPSNRKREKAG